jgi:mannose-1-phosphate guanylyltransferase
MRAMVLCAGLGTRLRPLTEVWPKPAIPLLGQPLVRHALQALKAAGVAEVGINTFHLPEVMEATANAECARLGLALTVSREVGEIQGTGGGIRGLKGFLAGDDFVVLNGDVLFDVDVAAAVRAHRAAKADATMVLLPMPEGAKFNAVECDPTGRVRRIAGKGGPAGALSGWHFSGMHVMSPAVFDFMAPSGPEDINHDVYLRMLQAGRTVHGHVVRDRRYWSDLGTLERYAATHRDVLFGQVPGYVETPRGEGNYWADPTARLNDVKVSGPAWFGARCELGQGVRIGSAVSVGPGAKVGDGAHLNRCIVFDGAVVAGGKLYEDVALYSGGELPLTAR